jgi:putative phosphoribosyl transferase
MEFSRESDFPFQNRRAAGRYLAWRLARYAGGGETVVLALPRGGVPVGYEVARALDLPLDVFVVRKLGFPGYEELAMGAIATGGVRVVNPDVMAMVSDPEEVIDRVSRRELAELERRERLYRSDAEPIGVKGKTVILVDDGLATGATMRAAVAALRKLGAAKIVVAVPVGSPETCAEFQGVVDDIVCAVSPPGFRAVGQYYEDFGQTSDDEVAELLSVSRSVNT